MIEPRANYDFQNIFWKIIKKETETKIILENDLFLSFYDINPKAQIHALVIPKGAYSDIFDFFAYASDEEKCGFFQMIQETIAELEKKHEEIKISGVRLINNNGVDAHQEVPHLHWHILAGKIN